MMVDYSSFLPLNKFVSQITRCCPISYLSSTNLEFYNMRPLHPASADACRLVGWSTWCLAAKADREQKIVQLIAGCLVICKLLKRCTAACSPWKMHGRNLLCNFNSYETLGSASTYSAVHILACKAKLLNPFSIFLFLESILG